MTYLSAISYKPEVLMANGSLHTSSYKSFGEYKVLNSNFPSLLLEQNGTGSFTTNANNVTMSVTSGQYTIITSRQFHPYFNGRPAVVEMTTDGFGSATNVEKSIGYISSTTVAPYNSSLDGFRLFKDASNNYSIEVWRNGTRTHNIARSTWGDNGGDKLDGSGPSGMTINWDNFNVFYWDFLYLGGTALRLFVMYGGVFRLVYQLNYANTATSPFLLSPNKQIRYEIRSTTGTGSMTFICATAGLMGEVDEGTTISVKGANAGISSMATGITYAICGVRKAASFRDIFARVIAFEGIINTNDFIDLELRINPTVAGVFTYSSIIDTPLESATGLITNTVTGGTPIGNTWFSLNMNNRANIMSVLNRLNSTLSGTMDTIVLCGTPALGSNSVRATGSMQVEWFNQ